MIYQLPQILSKQNTDFVHFIYFTNISNWPLDVALLHEKNALPCQSTDRAHWSNGVDEHFKRKHATIRQQLTALWSNGIQASSDWQRSDPMAYSHRQIDSALIQWHTVIVRLTALWSNGIQSSSDWQHSDPMAYSHRQIDSALIQWHTVIVRLTAL